MKSIFLGGDAMFRVFCGDALATLEKKADIQPINYKKSDILAAPEKFADTEYIFSTWGMPAFTEEEIRSCLPSLKAVFYGAGTVKGFAKEFLRCGVRVFSAWGANAVPVAEYTVAQILLANKGFYLSCRRNRSVEGHVSARSHFHASCGNFGAKVGIVGAGMIGKMVIRELQRYKLEVLVYDPFLTDAAARELGARSATLEELFATCDVISNHVANIPATVGMFTYELFSSMKKNATFINTGRGAQVVEADLIRAMREETERTAVLDVTIDEPPHSNSELYTLENIFLTPHIAGSAGDEVARMGEYMLEEYLKVSNGEEPLYEVTEKMLPTMA
jgi:phosphoglycerate dehydrogenase-like enzyme